MALAACGQNSGPAETAQAAVSGTAMHSGVLHENMDTSIRPGDDFNAFINGTWMATTDIPADRSAYGISTILHDEAQDNVKTIIEDAAKGDHAHGSEEQKVGDLYASYMDMETRNRLGVSPIADEFAKINALEDYEELAVYFAEANKIGISVPFTLNQYPDFKDPDTYMMYTYQSGLGLPNREYYLDENAKFEDFRSAYVEHIAAMFELAGLADGTAAADTIMAIETRLATEQMEKEKTRDMLGLYNKFPLDDLTDVMPEFAWDAYLAEAGIDDIDGLVVMMLDYMKALDNIIVDTSLDDWKTYLTWAALNSNAHLLTEELDVQNFEFYSRKLRGIEEMLPRWKRAVNNVNGSLGEAVGQVYVAKHFPPEAKQRMTELVDNLQKAYAISIEQLDWMGDETKAEALEKLSKFTTKIGYPDKWKNYSALEIDAGDLVGNLHRASQFEYQEEIARRKQQVDRSEWNMTPQTVNAYFSPPLNEIVFPAAILQPPFFDLYADDAINYGAIGAIIGHEIGHGFDDKGSTFDGDGVLRNWWTAEDRAEFEARTARLVDQYNQYKPFDDLSVNGEFTLGENIGDLGGLSIALLAYKLSLDGEEPPVMDGYTGWQRVFIGYGQSWRYKAREEALRHRIATDPHAPPEFRVNGVVRNVPEFYEAFDVAETDAMYLPPEERVKIW